MMATYKIYLGNMEKFPLHRELLIVKPVDHVAVVS